MTRYNHRCPATGCTQRVDFSKLMCLKHWKLVPREMQTRLYDAHERRHSAPEAHRLVMNECIEYVNAKLSALPAQGGLGL